MTQGHSSNGQSRLQARLHGFGSFDDGLDDMVKRFESGHHRC